MRERRWESPAKLEFGAVLALGQRLAAQGLDPAAPTKDVICYVEEWSVAGLRDLERLDPWPTEDVTLVHLRDGWRGDFFLLVGGYHTVYRRYQGVGTYCSVSHPWLIPDPLRLHYLRAQFWVGFRHAHSFIRVRLHTTEVITPGETRGDGQRAEWLAERGAAFRAAIALLELPIESRIEKGSLTLRALEPAAPLFCSWPDAFGPCQFEYNSSDAFEFLVPASRLAATCGGEAVPVRAYLTGFPETALEDFRAVVPDARLACRCSAHCRLSEIPAVLEAIAPDGRVYAMLCEFQTQRVLPLREDTSAIVGIVGKEGGFQIEVRLNRGPLPEDRMGPWLEALLGLPVSEAPLPPFP